ncbi:RNA 3'-terminal phosphate cyclase [Candidatus Woesearchaeota archaeon]|nr:RNA 3'-terminal phosphate cyclase [Candidatus Woesearchaeota archaeon]
MIELDGSHEEGGGQILRTALGLSVITQKAFRLKNIRKNRPEPGLKQQHLSCVKACTEFSNALVFGDKIASQELEFCPRAIKNRQLEVNIGTAGSIGLLFQSVMLPMMFTSSEMKIKGGTDVKWSMPIDYIINVIKPVIDGYCDIDIICEKRGYYPQGGGLVVLRSKSKFKRINFDSFSKFHQYIFANPVLDYGDLGNLMLIKGVSHASKNLQEREVVERQAKSAELILQSVGVPAKIDRVYGKTESTGSGLVLYGIYGNNQKRVGADFLGDIKIKAEEVGRKCSEKLMEILREEVLDEHMQDNMIPLLGLFGGKIKVGKITGHTKANINVCEKFLDVKYEIESNKGFNLISVLSSSKN